MRTAVRLSFLIPVLFLLSAAALEARAAKCRPCEVAQERCSVSCFGNENKGEMTACLLGCSNAAAFCTCDQTATLSAEDYATRFGLDAAAGFKSGACHDTTPCPSSYGACTNWSTLTACGDPFCGFVYECGECNEWGQCLIGGPGTKQRWEAYRVCLNEQSQACTEYQRFTSTDSCGC